ncbi:MAG: IclR family transcriptional regulator [Burkholderiaceae bacterium]|nr:IclR family transcriptional regulator [Burkholderiaceae bacterium]
MPLPRPAPSADAPARAPDPLFNQSLEKGLAVLRAFSAAHRTLTLSELAERTGMSKGSAQRTVHTLQVLGYVGKHPQTRRFRLLPQVIELGFNYLDAHPLIAAAHPYLSQLARASGETASLTEPVGFDMVYVAQILTTQHIPVLTPVGMRIPMYASSSGRAYLGQLPEAEARAQLTAMPRPARTRNTVTDVDALMAGLQACKLRGYATNCEELFLGDMGLAAPVFNARGEAIGAVHVAPPTSRWTLEAAEHTLVPLVMECARAISRLGTPG